MASGRACTKTLQLSRPFGPSSCTECPQGLGRARRRSGRSVWSPVPVTGHNGGEHLSAPVCGSMNAGVGRWLTASGVVPASYRVSEGQRVGRAGSILITADADGTVWVGGATTTCLRGTIAI